MPLAGVAVDPHRRVLDAGRVGIELVAIVVDDYDRAIRFFVDALGFDLVEDSPAVTNDGRSKRWVVVRPPGAVTGVLLARADPHQERVVGDLVAGRVGFFLRVDDFAAAHGRMVSAGVRFLTPPRTEPYGQVAVFLDVAGNRWDLLGPSAADAAASQSGPEGDAGVSAGEGARGGPLVVLLCGVAGSGKTTYAQQLELEGYVRLSMDEEIWARFGRYGIDYESADYDRLSAAAEDVLRERLVTLIRQGRDVVVDFSFWQRANRDRYKRLVEAAGGTWRLVYLRVDPAVLRQRLDERAERCDANAAFPITRDTLDAYLAGFEEPRGEGEEVIALGDPR